MPRKEKEAATHKALHNAQATYEAMYAIFCVPFACGASKYQALDTSTTKAEAEQHSEVGEQRENDTDQNGTVFGVRATQQFIVCVFSVVQTRTANLSTLAMRPLLDKVHHVNVDLKSVLSYVKVVETRPYDESAKFEALPGIVRPTCPSRYF